MPEPLENALAQLRPLLLDTGSLVRGIASGRRRGTAPEIERAELRPVDLASGRRLQVVTTVGGNGAPGPLTRNLVPGTDAEAAVDALLAQPFGSWRVETLDRLVQIRVTKRGEAQVHTSRTAPRDIEPAAAAHDRAKQRLIEPDDPLFAVLGADAAKRRQVDAFVRQLVAVVRRPAELAMQEQRPLRVVDLGCGNAYLTFAAHRYLTSALPHGVRTVGIDARLELVARNSALAAQLEMAGLSFVAGRIAELPREAEQADVVLALHACDTATDDALAAAVRSGARAILAAPCCHRDVQHQLNAARSHGIQTPHPYAGLVRHGILKERFADVLTDALRADLLRLLGYRVDVVEFIDTRHTPRNALLRAEWTGAPATPRRRQEYDDLVAAWHVTPALAERLASELAAAR